MRRQQAFTLIELLVVIGIIAVLIAILLPTLSKARESAKQIKCASNLRQLNILWTLYAHDNKGRFPTMYAPLPIYSTYPALGQDYVEQLKRYVVNPWIFYCPSTTVSPSDAGRWLFPAGSGNVIIDYSIYVNWKRMVGAVNRVSYTGPEAALVERVGDGKNHLVMMSDQCWNSNVAMGRPTWMNHPRSEGSVTAADRWRGMNVLFFDGHVVWRRKDEVKQQADYSATYGVFF